MRPEIMERVMQAKDAWPSTLAEYVRELALKRQLQAKSARDRLLRLQLETAASNYQALALEIERKSLPLNQQRPGGR